MFPIFLDMLFKAFSFHSAQWLYILDRAITVSANNDELQKCIIETAVNIPGILESCYSILMSPSTCGEAHEVYLPHAASVLFNFGSSRKEVSAQLLTALLGPIQSGFSHGKLLVTYILHTETYCS